MRIGNGRESFFLLFTDFFFLIFFYVKFPSGQSERSKHKIIFIVNYKEKRYFNLFVAFCLNYQIKVISPIFRAGFFYILRCYCHSYVYMQPCPSIDAWWGARWSQLILFNKLGKFYLIFKFKIFYRIVKSYKFVIPWMFTYFRMPIRVEECVARWQIKFLPITLTWYVRLGWNLIHTQLPLKFIYAVEGKSRFEKVDLR